MLSMQGGAQYLVDYAFFSHAEIAIHVGELTSVSLTNSKIINSKEAISVSPAGSSDEGTSYFYKNLPCRAPYTSIVTVSNTWFGKYGIPGAFFDAGSLPDPFIPEADIGADLVFFYQQMAQQELRMDIGTNTRPWTLYSCTIPGSPPIAITFPITPVAILTQPFIDKWLPAYHE